MSSQPSIVEYVELTQFGNPVQQMAGVQQTKLVFFMILRILTSVELPPTILMPPLLNLIRHPMSVLGSED